MKRPAGLEPLRQQIGQRAQLAQLGHRMLWVACGLAAGTGCSTGLEVRHLATGRIDTEAFELRGPDLGQLRREALRRCPQGAEVLRQAVRDQRATSAGDEGRIERWMTRAAAWADPPHREAQLLLVCRTSAQAQWLVPPAAADAAKQPKRDLALAPETAAEGPLPVGPILPEW